MTLASPSPSNTFFEPPSATDSLPLPAFMQKDGSGDWIIATSGQQDGVLVDYDGSGNYILVDVSDPYELVASGSDYGISQSGAAVAVLADAAGDVTIDTDLTTAPVAILGVEPSGDVIMVRDASPHLRLVSAGGNISAYEDL
jgi:hypothetical protein